MEDKLERDNQGGSGTLYLCATPIGNLEDITLRVLKTLRSVDLIAAEDTRNTLKLLNHYGIHKPLTSYHEHNKYQKAQELIERLRGGENIALVTDAGTPSISDPGEVLTALCLEQGLCVTSLPGACALITALTLSGMPARRFCFEGFLPADKKERTRVLKRLVQEERTVILYEAPHHLCSTLQELADALGNRKIVLCRELTKRYEEAVPMRLEEALSYCREKPPRGEYVLILEGADPGEKKEREQTAWNAVSVQDHMAFYEEQGMDRRQAMKQVALDRAVPKREIYQALIPKEEPENTSESM